MKEERILDLLGRVDEKYIAESAPGKERKTKKPVWIKVAALAACLCLAAGGIFVIARRSEIPPDVPEKLPAVTIPEYKSGGFGYEALICHGADELENGNPWREDDTPATLPVFKNGSYDPSGAGEPIGLDEAGMTAVLERAARALGLEISGIEKEADGETVRAISAATDGGRLTVYANGRLVYEPSDGKLPEEYNFTRDNASDAEAEAAAKYLAEKYAALLSFDDPVVALRGDYSFGEEYFRRYFVYDRGADATGDILNYCFRAAQFAPDAEGKLMMISVGDGLCKAEKLGDYPLISVEEATRKLLDGSCQTSVPAAVRGEEYIAKTELIYRSGPGEETLLPYYRFYVELSDEDVGRTAKEGLKTYGAYYVPAIREEYISNLSTYNGQFN